MAMTPVNLIICDGMGLSPELVGNAIQDAATPTFDYLFAHYPSVRLLASGTEVGLDMGEPGNSEVGHLALGTGQVLPQAFQMINSAIKSESYKQNKAFLTAMERVKKNDESTLHLIGLVSSGGVHGHMDHLTSLLELAHAKKVQRVAIHAITDGRDSPPQVALQDLEKITPLLDDDQFVWSKVEEPIGVANIDEIIEASDGIIVARGDLGIEVDMEEIPFIQKDMIKKCNAAGKPVMVATQMLATMVYNPRPTRAEVSDIANAVLDGSDYLWLSEESAQGKYPLEAVQMLAKVAVRAETFLETGK